MSEDGMPDGMRWERHVPIDGVDLVTHQIVDQQGRQRFFRGLNVVYKIYPWLPTTDKFNPETSFCADDLKLWADLNLNVVRLNMPWAAVEPEKGKYDTEYIAKVRAIVRACHEVGIWVVLDAHQDLYAQRFCGNGMPEWSITRDEGYSWKWPFSALNAIFNATWPFPIPLGKKLRLGLKSATYARPNPPANAAAEDTRTAHAEAEFPEGYDRSDWQFGRWYVSDAVTRAFWGLYTNQEGIRDHFVGAWRAVAEMMKDEPNLLGYELLNEPPFSARTTLDWLACWIDKSGTERNNLLSLYDAVVEGIRTVEDKSLIFYGPLCGNMGGEFGRVPGSKPVKGEGEEAALAREREAKKKSVLSWHYYPHKWIAPGKWDTVFPWRDGQVKKLGGAGMLTEFDCAWNTGKEEHRKEMRTTLEYCDKYQLSWIGWQYKKFYQVSGAAWDGSLVNPEPSVLSVRPWMARLFSRTYASAVDGIITFIEHDSLTGHFRLHYIPKGIGWTEVKICKKWHYPDGVTVQVTSFNPGWKGEWKFLDESEQTIGVWSTEGTGDVYVDVWTRDGSTAS